MHTRNVVFVSFRHLHILQCWLIFHDIYGHICFYLHQLYCRQLLRFGRRYVSSCVQILRSRNLVGCFFVSLQLVQCWLILDDYHGHHERCMHCLFCWYLLDHPRCILSQCVQDLCDWIVVLCCVSRLLFVQCRFLFNNGDGYFKRRLHCLRCGKLLQFHRRLFSFNLQSLCNWHVVDSVLS